MMPLVQERRRPVEGSIVSENDVLRLRVVQAGATLGLVLDARDDLGQWVAAATSAGVDLRAILEDGRHVTAVLYQFEPIAIRGVTRGVLFRGTLDGATLLWWVTLDASGPMTRHRIMVSSARPTPYRRLTQRWFLSLPTPPNLHWPEAPQVGGALAHVGAALLQCDKVFCGLAPDLEEGEPTTCGLESDGGHEPFLEYGVLGPDDRGRLASGAVRFAYALCYDARAWPGRGFQAMIRFLGARPALTHAVMEDAHLPESAELPLLPDAGAVTGPEPALLALPADRALARVAAQFARVDAGDLGVLDDALARLDWLLKEQCVYALPTGAPLGSLPSTPEWCIAAPSLPLVLWDAFRLTGLVEYAHRSVAALAVLPPALRAAVTARLHARFGDVYVQADTEEVIPLGAVTVERALFTPDAVTLTLRAGRPVRVVLDGGNSAYNLVVNGAALGHLSAAALHAGVSVGA
jgi:hypothetical protein